jgi:hypothetical protein
MKIFYLKVSQTLEGISVARGQFFKTSVGANLCVGANSAKCHHCVGVSSLRRRKNLF